jgi:cyclopropane fatty-acyl-phospholipid synthase-like methyltransferase
VYEHGALTAARIHRVRPADERQLDYRAFVAAGYDRCASAFNAARSREADGVLGVLFDAVPTGARVLDLGCGAGIPITRSLNQRYDVIGIDISAGQLALARSQAPGPAYLLADITSIDFKAASFDAIVSMYAIFHVPREFHRRLFERMRAWLRPGGWLLASLARQAESPYTEEFFGVEMYWSNYGMAEYRALLADAGFDIVSETALSHGYDDLISPVESHPLIFARRSQS